MDVARLNLSHGDYPVHEGVYRAVREASDVTGRAVGILVDLQGPKIRTGRFANGPISLAPGDRFTITVDDVPGDQRAREHDLQGPARRREGRRRAAHRRRQGQPAGRRGDGHRRRHRGRSRAGSSRNNKGINLPGVAVSVPAMSEKDIEDLRWALRLGVDFIALSFVRSAADVDDVHADHGRGGQAPARHRQDREAPGGRQPRRDHRRVRRRHGRPRRPRRRAAARGRAARPEARRRDRPPDGQAGDRRDPDARVDDRELPPDPGGGLRLRQRGPRRRRRGHAVRRDQRRRVADPGGPDDGPHHRVHRGPRPRADPPRSALARTPPAARSPGRPSRSASCSA